MHGRVRIERRKSKFSLWRNLDFLLNADTLNDKANSRSQNVGSFCLVTSEGGSLCPHFIHPPPSPPSIPP